MQATYSAPQDLSILFNRLLDMERLSTAQEWWMYGRVLPEARSISEITSLLAAARAEVGQLLEALGYPHRTRLRRLVTSELNLAQSYSGDRAWGAAHHDEAIDVLHMAALNAPAILIQTARIAYHLSDGAASTTIRHVLERVAKRLDEVRSLANNY